MPRIPIFRKNINYDNLFLDKYICNFIESDNKSVDILYDCVFNNSWFLYELREIIKDSITKEDIELIGEKYKKIHGLRKTLTKTEFVRNILILLRNNSIKLGELLLAVYNIFPSGEEYINRRFFSHFH